MNKCKSGQPITGKLHSLVIEACPKRFDEKANALAVVAVSLPIKEMVLLPVYYQLKLSITTNGVNEIDEACPYWLTPIVRYLSSEELLDNIVEAHKIQVQAARFSLVNGQLYKWSLNGPYLKCLTHQQGQYVLTELHDGVCRNHADARHWPIEPIPKATTSQPCVQMQSPMLGSVTAASDLFQRSQP